MRFSQFLMLFALVLVTACSKNPSGHSTVTLQVPSLAELNAKVGAQKVGDSERTWDRACFMINVTGAGLPSSSTSSCAIPSEIFAGTVAPSATGNTSVPLTIDVPKGEGRKIEVLAYFRKTAAEVCNPKAGGVSAFDPGRTAVIGSKTVSIQKDSEDVSIDISLPSSTQTLVTQYNLAATCDLSPVLTNGPKSLRATSGSVVQAVSATNGYKLNARISPSNTANLTSTNGYKLLPKGQ